MKITKTNKTIIDQTIELDIIDIRNAIEYWLQNVKKINGKFYNFEIKHEEPWDYDVRGYTYKAEISVRTIKD